MREAVEVTGPIHLTEKTRPVSWQSLLYWFPRMGTFRVGRVRAESYPVTLTLYRGATSVHVETITSDTDFRIPDIATGDYWSVDLTPGGVIDELLFFPRKIIQANDKVIHVARDGQSAFSWRALEFDLVKHGTFSCAKIHAEGSVTMTIRGDGTELLVTTVTSSAAFRLPVFPRCRIFEVDLVSASDIYELVLARNMGDLRR